jgi:hypothetical protein
MSFYVICVCLHIVVSNTYCVVLLLCFVVFCCVLLLSLSLSVSCPFFGFLLTFISRQY